MKHFHQVAIEIGFLLLLTSSVLAQTKVDLSTQAKNVDFSGASSTKPVQVGATLPAVCSIGQLFFNTGAPPGQNLTGCIAPNLWVVLSVTGGGGCGGGSVVWQIGGVTIASTDQANFQPGVGVLLIAAGGGLFQLTASADTSVMLSRAAAQASTSNFCNSTTGSTNYACSLSPTLQQYTGPLSSPPGSTCLILYVDTANSSGATINVDTLGPIPILERSGGSLSGGDIPRFQPVLACYNGSAFVLQK
jgi:hypothetical protein